MFVLSNRFKISSAFIIFIVHKGIILLQLILCVYFTKLLKISSACLFQGHRHAPSTPSLLPFPLRLRTACPCLCSLAVKCCLCTRKAFKCLLSPPSRPCFIPKKGSQRLYAATAAGAITPPLMQPFQLPMHLRTRGFKSTSLCKNY